MFDALSVILVMSGPLLFATLGALVSEHAGVLAVFMDGAITLSGFICIAAVSATGSPLAGWLIATAVTVLLLALVAIFNEKTGANPFITGLAVNLLASGLTSWLSVVIFRTRGVVVATSKITAAALSQQSSSPPASHISLEALTLTALPFLAAAALSLAFRHTSFGLNLRTTGNAPEVLSARGINPARYRIASWCIAAFFASCAGTELALKLGAWVPNLSAGRGWTALAACYLGYRKPLVCIGAVLLFSGAEWWATEMQGTIGIPTTVILGFPYLLALIAFIFIPGKKNC